MDDCYLTVKELKEALNRADLPDDMPVYYQRIEDSYFKDGGWKTKKMQFDFDADSDYIRAFSAYRQTDEGAFVINAHY